MASATDETTLRDALRQAEARLQDCLAQRPSPFFVQRHWTWGRSRRTTALV